MPYTTTAHARASCWTSEELVPSAIGALRVLALVDPDSRRTHHAVVHGDVANQRDVPVHVHLGCSASVADARLDAVACARTVFAGEERGVLVCIGAEAEPSASEAHDLVLAADLLRSLRVHAVRLPSGSR